jgi:hypothetical protein
VLNSLHHEDIWGSEGIAPAFLTSVLVGGEWAASLYPRGRIRRDPLARRLGEPQILSGRCGVEKNLALSGIEPTK